jgi:hypothetical protein
MADAHIDLRCVCYNYKILLTELAWSTMWARLKGLIDLDAETKNA